MTVEIEIKGTDAANEIYDLRNFIQEQEIQGMQLQLKEQPAIDGTMSFVVIAGLIATVAATVAPVAGEMLLKAGLELTLEKPVKKLENAIRAWLLKRKKEGKKDIEVYTEVKDGQSGKTFVTDSTGIITQLSNLNFAIDTGRTKVLIIGNSEFDHSFPAIKPVKGNVEDFYNMLTDKKIVGIPPENITIAFNKTSGEIEEQLLLASKLPDIETLIIYYAGHGYKADAKKLYLVAKNTKKIDDHIISAVDFDFIKNVILKQSVASQKIVILDACHSGIATQGADDFLTNFDVKGTYIFTSSSGDEVSYFNTENRNTFFTGEMINVLKNGLENFQERITLKDIYEAVAVSLKEKNFPEPRQKSELNIPLSNFFVARNLKFSVDKWKQKARQLFNTGRVDEAEHEYNRLLMQYPDDESLKAEAAQNEIEKNYLFLLGEGEDLFREQEYERAIEKYDAALKIKQEFSVLSKRNKSAEYLELKRKILDKNERRVDGPVIIKEPPKKNEPPVKPLQEEDANRAETTLPYNAVHHPPPSKQWYWAVLIHLLLFGFGVFYINPRSKRRWLYPACIFIAGLIILLLYSDYEAVQKDELYIFRILFYGGLIVGYIVGLIECIISFAGRPTAAQNLPAASVTVEELRKAKTWIYVICGVWLGLYFLSITSITNAWGFVLNCPNCDGPFQAYIVAYIFTLLPPLFMFLLLKRNKWGWMLALIAAALRISMLIAAKLINYKRYDDPRISLSLLFFIAVYIFLIYILNRAGVIAHYNISSKLKNESVIAGLILAILYIILALLA